MHELDGIENAHEDSDDDNNQSDTPPSNKDTSAKQCVASGLSMDAELTDREMRALEREGAPLSSPGRWRNYNTIHLCNHRISLGECVLLCVPSQVLNIFSP